MDAEPKNAPPPPARSTSCARACGLGSAPARPRSISSICSASACARASTSSRCRPRRRPARDAERCGIPLTTLDETPELDLTVDGADEIAPDLTLIKGGGGALLREKIVAAASARMIVIADETKWVPTLGRFPLPIEVAPFGAGATQRAVEAAIAAPARPAATLLRQGQRRPCFRHGWRPLDPRRRARPDRGSAGGWRMRLRAVPGVMEHGLFIGLAQTAMIGGPDGVRVVERR